MLKWTKPLSWTKVSQILTCPKKLEFSLSGILEASRVPSYYRVLGITSQYVLEQYFNQKINLYSKGTQPEVIDRVITKVLDSPWMNQFDIAYPVGVGRETLNSEVRRHVTKGVEMLREKKALTQEVTAEFRMVASLRGVNAYAQIDFVVGKSRSVAIYDGKSTSKANADGRQLKLHAAILAAGGYTVTEASYLYWGLGKYGPVDVSPSGLKNFIDGDWGRVVEVGRRLKEGVESLKSTPGPQCVKCNFNRVCPDSGYRVILSLKEEVGFGE